jgi:prepilin signal peptidase PulO-like enzyme (type II secretory pathway)
VVGRIPFSARACSGTLGEGWIVNPAEWSAYWMIVAFIFGLFIGSFLNVVAYRLPRGESVIWPRSHCPHCQRTLKAWELVPCLSWICLGGRCRTCKNPIGIRYPTLELVTGLLFAITVLAAPSWPVRATWAVFWILLVAVIGTDLTDLRVPDVLSLPGAILVAAAVGASGWRPWTTVVLGMVVCAGVLWLIHWISGGRMGLGDVKLYLSIGAFLGPLYGLESLVFASLSGVVTGVLLRVLGLLRRREFMPFVPHIAVGCVLALIWGPKLTAWYLYAAGWS